MPPKKSNLTNARSREARRKRVERARQSAKQIATNETCENDPRNITEFPNESVDPIEHARNGRIRHLIKLRQSKFRDRQRFIPSTSSQQTQELEKQENYVDDDRHQEALENLPSSDPSHSTGSCSQTILTLRKIKENFDLRESQDNDILNLHTHIDIKQDVEDIDTCVPNLFPASSSQTNSACGSPSRETHIETFTEHDPLNTMDVIVMKEEPGSPSSDVSIHLDAADSPEEEEIKNTLRKKIKMLNESKEILKRIHEEISILKKERKELVTDVKYLQTMSKKKCKLLVLNEL